MGEWEQIRPDFYNLFLILSDHSVYPQERMLSDMSKVWPCSFCPGGAARTGATYRAHLCSSPSLFPKQWHLFHTACANVPCPGTCQILRFTIVAMNNGNNAFLFHSGGLKELKKLVELVSAHASPSLRGRDVSGCLERCLVLVLIPGSCPSQEPPVHSSPPRSIWAPVRIWVYSVLSPVEPFAFVQHFFVVLVIQANSLLNQHLSISRRASWFRTSIAALVPLGGNKEHRKIK